MKKAKTTAESLPDDIWYIILEFFNIYELTNARLICKFLCNAIDKEYLKDKTLMVYNSLPKLCCGKRTKKKGDDIKECLHKKKPSICCAFPFVPRFTKGQPFIKNDKSYYVYNKKKRGYMLINWIKCKKTGAIQRPTEYNKQIIKRSVFGYEMSRKVIRVPLNNNPGWLRKCQGIRINYKKLEENKNYRFSFLAKVHKSIRKEYNKNKKTLFKDHLNEWMESLNVGMEKIFI